MLTNLGERTSNNILCTVAKDFVQTGGNVTAGNGTLNVGGSYSVSGYSYLTMNHSDGRVNVAKDFTMKSDYSAYTYSELCDGILTIGGNLYQYNTSTSDSKRNLYCSGYHITKFVGEGSHFIRSESINTRINTLEVGKDVIVCFEGSLNDIQINGAALTSSGSNLIVNSSKHSITGETVGSTSLKITNGNSSASIPVIVNNGVPAGDVNLDGKFNIADVVMLQRWLVKNGGLTYWKAGDMDGNGRINAIDLTLMKRTLMK